MAVWSSMIGYFRLSVLCLPFAGFQVSTEDSTLSTISATISVDVFGCVIQEFFWLITGVVIFYMLFLVLRDSGEVCARLLRGC